MESPDAAPRPGSPALERTRFERALALAIEKRLLDENSRLEYRVAELEADRAALRSRLQESEQYVRDVKTSRPWRVIQLLRGFVGRRW